MHFFLSGRCEHTATPESYELTERFSRGHQIGSYLFHILKRQPFYTVHCRNYLGRTELRESIHRFHYRWIRSVLLCYKSHLYIYRAQSCEGLIYCSTPAQWIQLKGDFHTRSLQGITCTKNMQYE